MTYNPQHYKERCDMMRTGIGQTALREGWGYSLWLDSEDIDFDFDSIPAGHYRSCRRKAEKIWEDMTANKSRSITPYEALAIQVWIFKEHELEKLRDKFAV